MKHMRDIQERSMRVHTRPSSSAPGCKSRFGRVRFRLMLILFAMLALPAAGKAQDAWYFHTVNSHSLSALYGRTYKLDYAYQLSKRRQLKITGLYVFDEFSINPDRVKSDIYNVNVQFQYNVIHVNQVFLNANFGVGGYSLKAGNILSQRHRERKINFIGGFQGEYYLRRSSLAVIVDYDILYLPFSDLYEFLHIPTVGMEFFF